MTKLSIKEKVNRIIRWLTTHHVFAHGGYAYDFEIHAGRLFVAGLDDAKERNRTVIQVFDIAALAPWYDAAAKLMDGVDGYDADEWPHHDDFDFGDWSEAFWETEPKSCRR